MALCIRETASYAAGDSSHHSLGEASRRLTGKHRRTVYSQASRPLFVAEAELRAGKVFTRSKKGLLALYGTDLHVVDVLGLEAAESNGLADVTQHVLRWVNYINLLDVSFTGPATLKIEHGDTSDKAKIRAAGESLSAASEDDMYTPGLSMGGASASTSAAGGPPGSSAGSSNASIRVTSESFTLTFRDAGIAQRAAAALLFQQAQYAAVRHWLRTGLHAGFRCDLISVQALPLMFHDHSIPSTSGPGALGALTRSHSILPAHVLYSCASGSFSGSGAGAGYCAGRASGAGGHAAGAGLHAGAAAAAAAVPYPWGDADAQEWGCSVPLPAGWGPLLDAAAASEGSHGGRHRHEQDEQGVTPEELTVPVVLDHGPKAVQVTISTPLGAAVATITPQLAKAALMHSTCREILALPLHPSSSSSSSAAPMIAFNWSVHSSVSTARGAAAAAEGSTGSSGSTSTAGAQPEAGGDADAGGSISSAGAQSSGGLPLMHTVDAFAVLMVQIVRSPMTANTRGAGRVFDPAAAQAPAAPAAAVAGSWGAAPGQQHLQATGAGESSSNGSSSGGWQSSSSVQVQLAVCALLAAVTLQQFSGQLWLLLLQLLLLAVLAATAIKGPSSKSSSSSGSSQGTSGSSAGRPPPAAWLQGSSDGSSSNSTEDPKCCGWSMMLIGADLCSAPGRHLQLQVSLAKACKSMARLRLRMASMSAGGAPVALLGAPSEEEEDVSVPVLVSDPEPAWLTPDTKQRFINAKPSLEASQEQAQRTNKWRQQMGIDSVLSRPCPKFPLMCRLLPTYLLSDDSPEGHAVFLMKVGGVKDLCDAIFQTPEGSPEGLSMVEAEHTLALLNEYLVWVAAPKPLPGGFQVQIYDLAGFKLSYVMGDMFTLFKMLVRFGLYYPERLRLALVINAPVWFSTPWKAMSSFLDENTSAKVVVVGKPQSALSTLSHHLGGIDNVPVAWGGNCSLPFEEYPANVRMQQYGQRLNAGEQPFAGLPRSS